MANGKHDKGFWVSVLTERNNNRSKTWVRAVVVSIVLLLITTCIDLVIQKPSAGFWSYFYDFILSLLKSVTTGIVAAAALNLVYTFSDNNDLKKIRCLPYKELSAEIFSILESYEGKVRLNERIEVHMNKHPKAPKDLIEITIEYEFRTNNVHDYVRLLFERCFNGEIDSFLIGGDDRLNGLEFYWGNDETAVSFQLSGIDDLAYKVSRVAVNNVEIEKSDIKPVIEIKENGNRVIVYDVPISVEAKRTLAEGDKYSTLILAVSFPMEIESYMAITHEYPTYDSKVSVDYSDIASDTSVFIIPTTGPISVEPQKNTKANYHEYRHKGWIIPKTGYLITWWRN